MAFSKRKATAGGAVVLAGSLLAGTFAFNASAAGGDPTDALGSGTDTQARLHQLNDSNVRGTAHVHSEHRKLHIKVNARGLAKNLPHAQHIHFGAKARNECPTFRDDKNRDFRLTTTDGAPAYGPIKVSLTKRGGTGAGSGLAVTRFPTAPNGKISYERQTRTTSKVARAIRRGDAVVVIHGVDYNRNGKYDFRGAGKSDLDPNLPAEATDPVTCGVLRVEDSALPTP